jgi:hypothetical protein
MFNLEDIVSQPDLRSCCHNGQFIDLRDGMMNPIGSTLIDGSPSDAKIDLDSPISPSVVGHDIALENISQCLKQK